MECSAKTQENLKDVFDEGLNNFKIVGIIFKLYVVYSDLPRRRRDAS